MAVRCNRALWARVAFSILCVCLVVASPTAALQQGAATAPAPAPSLTLAEQEAFLKTAKVIRQRGVSKGITGTIQATLTDGRITHDASIQSIDEYHVEYKTPRGTEFNFRDSWRYNVAAYRLDRLLELGMIPPSVERAHRGLPSSFTWWVDDVIMDEGQRLKKQLPAPDIALWNSQMWHVRLFDQLIYNVDRNLGNLVIDKHWTMWMIDHSRAFRLFDKLKSPESLSKVDRQVFARLQALDASTLREAMGNYLTGPEMKALLARRDLIVAWADKTGPDALFDRHVRVTTAGQ